MVCRFYGVFDAAAMVCLCGFLVERVGVSNIKKRCNGVSGEWQLFSYNRCSHDTRVFFVLQMHVQHVLQFLKQQENKFLDHSIAQAENKRTEIAKKDPNNSQASHCH
jgi:hypothetical protein